MDDYPLLNIFWTMMWLFLWILWFFLLFRIFGDLFRDDSVGGWGKAGWAIGRRLESIARLLGEEIPSQDEDLAQGSGSVRPQCRLARPDQCLE